MSRSPRIRFIAGTVGVACSAGYVHADVVTFRMSNVHWHNVTYIGNTTMARPLDWYGGGSFTWTYTPGNFAGGQGALVSLELPPWGVGPGGYPTTTIIDANGFSTTLNANVDNLTYDIAFNFAPALSRLGQSVDISGGTFQFYPGTYQFLSGEYDGTITGGVVTACPVISSQPDSATACPNGSAQFSVLADGAAPLMYQWQLQTSPGVWQGMGNDPGPLPCGGGAFAYAAPINSANVTIGIRPCPGDRTAPQRFLVRAVVSNTCGSTATDPATYTICPADFNCSGAVSVQDIFDFLSAYFSADPRGDFNASGTVSVQDIFDFLSAYFAGC